MAGGSRFAHHYIADSIGLHFNIMFCGEIKKILADFLFFFRRTRHLVDLVEDGEHRSGLEVFDSHVRKG